MLKILFTLSHGQAFIERGFSTNKGTLQDNIKEKTIVAKRMVLDGLASKLDDAGDVSKFPITDPMINYFRKSYNAYKSFLKTQNNSESLNSTEQVKLEYKRDLVKERDLKTKLEKNMECLTKEANELSERAVKEKKMSLVVESNNMRERALDLQKNVETSKAKIRKLEGLLAKH